MANIANIAATIHAFMCDDPGFGYSWGERYGNPADPVTITVEGRDYTIDKGDYDCSSSVITAWQTALEGTAYEGALDGATYTGNMRWVFTNSGLFDVWDTDSTSAVRGDVYLNDDNHTAMCQDGGDDGVYGYDCLSEFSINEFGEVYGGQRGDQNGWESHITGFYNYPWYCTLHYNGAADNTRVEPTPAPAPAPEPVKQSIKERAAATKSWPVQIFTSNGSRAQLFKPKFLEDNWLSLKCVSVGKYLDVKGGVVANGTPVRLYDETGHKAQKWKFVQKKGYKTAKAAPYEIVSALDENYCLDVKDVPAPGNQVQLWERNGTKAQEWYRLDNGKGQWTLVHNGDNIKLVLDAVDGV